MNVDNFTVVWTVIGFATMISAIALSICKGCCIAKLLRKPCKQ